MSSAASALHAHTAHVVKTSCHCPKLCPPKLCPPLALPSHGGTGETLPAAERTFGLKLANNPLAIRNKTGVHRHVHAMNVPIDTSFVRRR